jgi:hypothetical protein
MDFCGLPLTVASVLIWPVARDWRPHRTLVSCRWRAIAICFRRPFLCELAHRAAFAATGAQTQAHKHGQDREIATPMRGAPITRSEKPAHLLALESPRHLRQPPRRDRGHRIGQRARKLSLEVKEAKQPAQRGDHKLRCPARAPRTERHLGLHGAVSPLLASGRGCAHNCRRRSRTTVRSRKAGNARTHRRGLQC